MTENTGIIGRIVAAISPSANNGIVGRVTVLPPQVQPNPNAAQTIQGEVVQTSSNGRVEISTPQGNVEVQVKSRPLPAAGTRVEITIPKGETQARQVNITIPQQTNTQAPNQGQPTAAQPQITPQQAIAEQSQPPRTPQPIQNQDAVNAARDIRPATPQPQALQNNQNIRLVPLNSVQLQQTLQTLPQLQLQQITQSLQTLSQQIVNALPNALTTPPAPALTLNTGGQTLQPLQPVTQLITTPQITGTAPPTVLPQSQSQFSVQIQPQQTQPQPSQTLQIPNITITPQQTGVLFVANPPSSINTPAIQNIVITPTSITTPQIHTNPIGIQLDTILPQNIQIKAPDQTIHQTIQQSFQNLTQAVQNKSHLIQHGSPQSIPAIVIGKTEAGFPILFLQAPGAALPQGFILQTPTTNLQIGTSVTLRVSSLSGIIPTQTGTPAQASLQTQQFPLNVLLRPGAWPSMNDLFQTLQQSAPTAAQAMGATVPSPAQGSVQLTLAAFLFIAAVKSGDFSNWLGSRGMEAINRAGKGSLINTLGNEANALNRGDTVINGEWRAMPLPMMTQGEIQKITLYTKYNGEGNESDQEGDDKTRFIFDLDLTRMGAVQLDGLIQNEKRLDLVIRSQAPFSEPMRQTMRHAYTNALESVDFYGELGFQGDASNWVNVLEENTAIAIDL